ncbi:MAG: T9SS type A sorting domain-containing protein, partial [Bacteroidia bacterium]|nr:T9SS type A sorting domain-containing protein [Bacteroidia bacterium]
GDVGNDSIAENISNALQLTNVDTDSNGIPNGYPMGDYDGDGFLDFLDIDVDNDGIADNREAQEGHNITNYTMVASLNSDADGDGLDDRYDPDQSDGLVSNTTANGTAIAQSNALDDFDGDGVPNHKDMDSDNDGIVDLIESDSTNDYTAFSTADVDMDGLYDIFDADTTGVAGSLGVTPFDDGDDTDGFADYLDFNADNDAYVDYVEAVDYNLNAQSQDDYETMASNYSPQNGGVAASNYSNAADSDGDGIPNWLDMDVIGNNFPNFLNPAHSLYSDTDNDGLVDLLDSDQNGSTPFGGTLIPGTIVPYPSDYNDITDPQSDWRDINTHIYLPVEWLKFEAIKVSNTSALLTWATASEKNSERFEVYKSIDGVNYDMIGEVAGNGTTNEISSYSFLDPLSGEGTSYYQLKQVDYNSDYELSEIRHLVNSNGKEVIAYPNPTKDVTRLVNVEKGTEIQVYELSGLDVTSSANLKNYGNEVELDLSGFRSGTYLVKLQNKNHQTIKRISLVN